MIENKDNKVYFEGVIYIIHITGSVRVEKVFSELTKVRYTGILYYPQRSEIWVSGGPNPWTIFDDIIKLIDPEDPNCYSLYW